MLELKHSRKELQETTLRSFRKYMPRLSGVVTLIILASCTSTSFQFTDSKVVEKYPDDHPIPVPVKNEFEPISYRYDVLVRRPLIKGLDVSKIERARDVNSMDNVPASSWFTPRLGFENISPERLLRGPEKIGPPELPIKVVKAKTLGGNPGFIIKDARGHMYLTKFDPPDFPAIETTTALIVNRMYWGFGYNVPEDYLFYFRERDLHIDPAGELKKADVKNVLSMVVPPENGIYRSTVSLFVKGIILGPVADKGTRKNDFNDKIAHENRRVLRALRVFNAFTNHSNMRIDNSLDVYVGEPGHGYVKHYLLDFGEAFAGHAAGHNYLWDGFSHIFSFGDVMKNFVTAGMWVKNWENLEYTKWRSIGPFESGIYSPAGWKEVYPYHPIRNCRPEDAYWAAKILSALTDEHIRALVDAAQYPEEDAAEYMIKTLIERRDKTLRYFLSLVSPLELVKIEKKQLVFEDQGSKIFGETGSPPNYGISFFDKKGRQIKQIAETRVQEEKLFISLTDHVLNQARGYFRITILSNHSRSSSCNPAEFHFRIDKNAAVNLVGVVH
ncbi:MAG: hypothetical protein DWQ05_19615 [Calditrichaeota bacterium]|nr:MAG: hypothetical protein DWQ05_19615 [Calditrichota bacterium]